MFSHLVDPTLRYPDAEYGPDSDFPELGGVVTRTAAHNPLYAAVRALIASSGWDEARYGTEAWNPFGEFVRPGQTVVVKPNMVLHSVPPAPSEAIVTHASVVRVLVDYALLALRGADGGIDGQVIIADVPLQSADFAKVCREAGYDHLMEHYAAAALPVTLLDLRPHHAVIDDHFFILRREPLPGDPAGSVLFNLGTASAHYAAGVDRDYSIQDYEDGATAETHSGETQLYNLSRTILSADVIINVCKIKTHNKAGVTLSLKNFIGANVSKDYLPHFTRGAPRDGGDEYARRTVYSAAARSVRAVFQSRLGKSWAPAWRVLRAAARKYEKRRFQDYVPHGGGWFGNDTLWRTIVDVNRLVRRGRVDGSIAGTNQRTIICFGDGVIAGEGEGPLRNSPRPAGLLCMGDDGAAFDALVAWIMGFDYTRIPHIMRASTLDDTPFVTADDRAGLPHLGFAPAPGWRGHIERVAAPEHELIA